MLAAENWDLRPVPKLIISRVSGQALRIAYNEPIPQRLVQAIRLDRMGHFSGQFFTSASSAPMFHASSTPPSDAPASLYINLVIPPRP